MLGAIYGDIIGSYYEVHCTKDYDFPFMPESTFTDDTVMTAAVCSTILADDSPISLIGQKRRAKEYAIQYKRFYSYFPNAGYGQMFSKWAQSTSLYPQRSYGNGAAMRTVPIGWAYNSLGQVLIQARASCLYTHFSSEAIKGAQAVAGAVFLAKSGYDKEKIRDFCENLLRVDISAETDKIRKDYCFDSRTRNSVPQAITAFLRQYRTKIVRILRRQIFRQIVQKRRRRAGARQGVFVRYDGKYASKMRTKSNKWSLCGVALSSNDYESAIRNAVSLGGDADTMACIAGGIAEAYYRRIPQAIISFCNIRLDLTIKKTTTDFINQYCT